MACYYKAPLMFVMADDPHEAQKILGFIKDRFMNQEGDFQTTCHLKSMKSEYTEYYLYTNVWILRAAHLLKMEQIINPAYQFIQRSYVNGNYLTNSADLNNGITDILTTAHVGLAHLERNESDKAIAAGNSLEQALINQPDLDKIFFLRCDEKGKIIIDYPSNQELFYSVNKEKPNQLYFMIGYPCAYLALLYDQTKQQKFLKTAKFYFDFAINCHPSVLSSRFSHKIAGAASILYNITKEPLYLAATHEIVTYFIKQQGDSDIWFLDEDVNTAYDQSAEITCWLTQIYKNIWVSDSKLVNNKEVLVRLFIIKLNLIN